MPEMFQRFFSGNATEKSKGPSSEPAASAVLRFVPAFIFFSVFLIDRVTKELARGKMIPGSSIPVLPFFHLTYVENTGAAFGMGRHQNQLFIFVSSVLILLFMAAYKRLGSRYGPLFKNGTALVIGGAVGNLYDRIAYGSVIDFLDFFAGKIHWPAFNAADSAICAGVFLLLFSKRKQAG